MNCKFHACKHNKEEVCQKYENADALLEDFKKGGGCAFTWFFSGRLPNYVKPLECGCGNPATHFHDDRPCCGGEMCCPTANE